MRRLLIGFICATLGYVAGAFGGGYLVTVFSGNTHDPSVEAAMTGALILGPLGAVVALMIGVYLARPRP
jgi:hypothetical protein